MKKRHLIFFLPLLFLHQCAPTIDAVAVPKLLSPARSQAWGTPKVASTNSGYQAIYENPSNSKEKITITGSNRMLPSLAYAPPIRQQTVVGRKIVEKEIPQKFSKAEILGKSVKYYQAYTPRAERGAVFRSLGLELTSPSGGTAHYGLQLEGSENQVRKWLSELRFAQ